MIWELRGGPLTFRALQAGLRRHLADSAEPAPGRVARRRAGGRRRAGYASYAARRGTLVAFEPLTQWALRGPGGRASVKHACQPRVERPLTPGSMNPEADQLWRAPRWALAVLLACWACWGRSRSTPTCRRSRASPRSLGATPVQMQQTLSAYLFGFAFMNLFHGALADSFGRRPVVLWGMAVFTLASAGCALSQTIGATGVLPRAAGAVGRRGHRGVARHHPRHVPAGAGAAGDDAR